MGKLDSYLRVRRRRWQLTQGELAFLLGYDSGSVVSRFERRERTIPLAIGFACELIFDADAEEIFPGLYGEVEGHVTRRMHELQDRLQRGASSAKTAAKLQLLDHALTGAANGADRQ